MRQRALGSKEPARIRTYLETKLSKMETFNTLDSYETNICIHRVNVRLETTMVLSWNAHLFSFSRRKGYKKKLKSNHGTNYFCLHCSMI